MNTLYRKNLALLKKRITEIETILENEEARPVPEGIIGKRGMPTVSCGGRLLHSKLDPLREAEKIIEHAVEAKAQVHVFLGMGYGYHIEEYLKRYQDTIAFVIEREETLLKSAMENRDLSWLLTHPRLRLYVHPELEKLGEYLSPLSGKKISPVALEQFTHSAPEYYREAERVVREFSSRREVNMATLTRFGKLWVRNLAKNLPLIAEAEDVGKLQGRFEGVPALLLAAGPSLDDVLPHMEELRRRAVIVAVDTAAGALITAGFSPDIMVVVDPQYWNTRHLDKGFLRKDLLRHSFLISESSTHPAVFRLPVNRIFIGGSLFPLGEYLEEAAGGKMKLGAGGSVATTAWDIAFLIGADSIFTSGLDLGFPGGKTHYGGGFFETLLHSISRRFAPYSHHSYSYIMGGDPFLHRNNSGDYTLTDKRLAVYRRWFEEQQAKESAPKTFSLSPRAVKIEGVEPASIEELLALPDRRNRIDETISSIPRDEEWRREEKSRNLILRAENLVEELKSLRELSARGLRTVEALIEMGDTSTPEFQMRRQAYLERLDSIDKAIQSSAGRHVAGFILQPILEELMGELARNKSFEGSLGQSKKIYSELHSSADYHIHLFSGLPQQL